MILDQAGRAFKPLVCRNPKTILWKIRPGTRQCVVCSSTGRSQVQVHSLTWASMTLIMWLWL